MLPRLCGVSVRKLPSPTPERQMTLVARDAEARRLLSDSCLPRLVAVLPHLASEITVTP